MDVSVTVANLDVSVTRTVANFSGVHGCVRDRGQLQWGCNLATHCSVFERLCLRKAHLFAESSVELRAVPSP